MNKMRMYFLAMTALFWLEHLSAVPPTVTLPAGTVVDTGESLDVTHGGIIETTQSSAIGGGFATLGGGDAFIISSKKIVLKPGFLAMPNSSGSFWAVIDPDSDGDGMTDLWELMNGLNPYSAADASADPDGDGITNINEFNSGTNAMVHNSLSWFGAPSAIAQTSATTGMLIIDPAGAMHAVNQTTLQLQ